jgi:hypothetical protein
MKKQVSELKNSDQGYSEGLQIMSVLKSNLFTKADPDTVNRLENCATGQPNEVLSHFTLDQTGEHIQRVQQALQSVQQDNPGLGIPGFSVNGIYDGAFAEAIRVYKKKRHILNFDNKIDAIVGIHTIRSLDRENKSSPPRVNPGTTPPLKKPGQFPKPATSTLRIIRRKFSKSDTVKTDRDAQGGDAKEAADGLRDLLIDGLIPEANAERFADGPPQTAAFPVDFRVNRFTTTVHLDEQLLKGGLGTLTITNTTMTWEWGQPLSNVTIVSTDQVTVFGTQASPHTKTITLARAAAEKTPFFVPRSP